MTGWPKRVMACTACAGTGEVVAVDGEALKAARKRAGLTLRRLGTLVGLSAQYLCEVEHNRSFPTRRVLAGYEAHCGGPR